MIYSDSDIRTLKGIGDKKAQAFNRLGIFTVYDLISFYPRKYEDRSLVRNISDLTDGDTCCIKAVVADDPKLSRIRRGLEIVRFRAFDDTGLVEISYFNQSYLKNVFSKGEIYYFYGKAERKYSRATLNNPTFEREEDAGSKTGRIVPIYRLSSGLTQKNVIDAVSTAVDLFADTVPEIINPGIRNRNELVQARFAYKNIHFPADIGSLELARKRLIFEELFLLSCSLGLRKHGIKKEDGIVIENASLPSFLDALPFTPTGAQMRAISECTTDMKSGHVMNRLLQGDVGSGKTLVAAALIYYAFNSGYSSALMVPTEVLAEQHYKNLCSLFSFCDLRIELLTGSTTAAEKRRIKNELRDGNIDLIIGTHALFSDDVIYSNLGLVITDEQHRFGVKQRSAIVEKAGNPHILVMSATPIPRSLALIIYGDLDISVLDELPPGRKKIDTYQVDESYRERLFAFVRKQVDAGHQVYIVCPKVDEDPSEELKSVKKYADELSAKLPGIRVDYMHGRMSAKEKDRIMSSFMINETKVLVSTTVIEVGVDVPNASLMIIENAERFGLSQLHQLRGRVGRGSDKSYCVLVSDNSGEDVKRRLNILCSTNDGFVISEEDLKIRGPGDFFGERQHGLPEMHIADLGVNVNILQTARDEANALLESDPDLKKEENRTLKEQVGFLLDKNLILN